LPAYSSAYKASTLPEYNYNQGEPTIFTTKKKEKIRRIGVQLPDIPNVTISREYIQGEDKRHADMPRGQTHSL
jgi:hypothetical protein